MSDNRKIFKTIPIPSVNDEYGTKSINYKTGGQFATSYTGSNIRNFNVKTKGKDFKLDPQRMYLTSKPYSTRSVESFGTKVKTNSIKHTNQLYVPVNVNEDHVTFSVKKIKLKNKKALIKYSYDKFVTFNTNQSERVRFKVSNIKLSSRNVLRKYKPIEDIRFKVKNVKLNYRTVLIKYNNYAVEKTQFLVSNVRNSKLSKQFLGSFKSFINFNIEKTRDESKLPPHTTFKEFWKQFGNVQSLSKSVKTGDYSLHSDGRNSGLESQKDLKLLLTTPVKVEMSVKPETSTILLFNKNLTNTFSNYVDDSLISNLLVTDTGVEVNQVIPVKNIQLTLDKLNNVGKSIEFRGELVRTNDHPINILSSPMRGLGSIVLILNTDGKVGIYRQTSNSITPFFTGTNTHQVVNSVYIYQKGVNVYLYVNEQLDVVHSLTDNIEWFTDELRIGSTQSSFRLEMLRITNKALYTTDVKLGLELEAFNLVPYTVSNSVLSSEGLNIKVVHTDGKTTLILDAYDGNKNVSIVSKEIFIKDWTDVSIILSNTTLEFYINGSKKSKALNLPDDTTVNVLSIGGSKVFGSSFKGYIDDFRLYHGEELILSDGFELVDESKVNIYDINYETLDYYNNRWYPIDLDSRTAPKTLPSIRSVGSQDECLYLDGSVGLITRNLRSLPSRNAFTIELKFKSELTYGTIFSITDAFVCQLLNREIRITLGRETILITVNANIDVNNWYHLSVVKNDLNELCVYVNGNLRAKVNHPHFFNLSPTNEHIIKDTIDTNCFALGIGLTNGNELKRVYERVGQPFKGFINDLYINMNECLRTNNFQNFEVPLDKNYITSKLQVKDGFVTDENKSILWTSEHVDVIETDIVNNAVDGYLDSIKSNLLSIDRNDFSIKFSITPTQIVKDTVILDTRERDGQEEGLVILQPPENSGSIEVRVGNYVEGSQENTTYNGILSTGTNSILPNTKYDVLLIKNVNMMRLYLNGQLKHSIKMEEHISPTHTFTLLNSKKKDKGFIGKLHSFMFINGQSI